MTIGPSLEETSRRRRSPVAVAAYIFCRTVLVCDVIVTA